MELEQCRSGAKQSRGLPGCTAALSFIGRRTARIRLQKGCQCLFIGAHGRGTRWRLCEAASYGFSQSWDK